MGKVHLNVNDWVNDNRYLGIPDRGVLFMGNQDRL